MKSLKVFSPEGQLQTDEVFVLGKRTAGNTARIESFKLFKDEITYEFLYDSDGYNTVQNIYRNEKLVQTFNTQNIEKNLTAGAFIKEFNQRYAGTDGLAHLAFKFYFDVRGNQVANEEFDHFFKVSVLAGDGAGNELVLIQEPGEHCGKIYDNDHETGLYTVEDSDCVLEYLGDEKGLDEDELKEMNKNELIKLLPFYKDNALVADNLNVLLNSVYICSLDTYRTRIEDLLKLIAKTNQASG